MSQQLQVPVLFLPSFQFQDCEMAVQCTAADGDEMHEGPLSLYPLSDADARAANNVMHEVVPVVQSGFLLWERESKCPRAQVANT